MAIRRGIDVSKWEPVVKWAEVRSEGYEFVFVKASQGTVEDPLFKTHWQNSKGHLLRSAYHFYDPVANPKLQAQKFWSLISADRGEITPVVDIEAFTSGTYHGATYWYDFIAEFFRLSGTYPIIYTAYYYWMDNVKIKPVQDVKWFSDHCRLWVANYGVAAPLVPPPWTDWDYWQYSETGLVKGVYDQLGRLTECDLDYCKVELPPLPVEEPVSTSYTVTSSYTMKVRSDHDVAATQTDSVPANTPMQADLIWIAPADGTNVRAGDEWAHILTPVSGWVAVIHLGDRYSTYTVNPSPTPTANPVVSLSFTFNGVTYEALNVEMKPK